MKKAELPRPAYVSIFLFFLYSRVALIFPVSPLPPCLGPQREISTLGTLHT
jgi:hypothetical protein